jgi:hypothetical protein
LRLKKMVDIVEDEDLRLRRAAAAGDVAAKTTLAEQALWIRRLPQ